MQALILAGGQGTRLRPHTEALPKPLLPLGKKTILDRQIETLLSFGVERICLVTGYFADKIRVHLETQFPNRAFIYIHNAEFEQSRPAFAIIQALPTLAKEDCLYLNGDVLYDREILARIMDAPTSATALQRGTWDEEQVKIIHDENGYVSHLSKNIPAEDSCGEFIGVTKLSAGFLSAITTVVATQGAETFRYSFAIDLLDHALHVSGEPIQAIDVTDLSATEIDTPEDYARALQTHAALEQSEHAQDLITRSESHPRVIPPCPA